MNQKLCIAYCAFILLMLTACDHANFTIQAQLDGTPDHVVTIVYIGNQGPVIERITLDEGNNTMHYTGHSDQPTLLYIWDQQQQLIAQMVVCDGDNITVKSDGLQLPTLDVKGNDVTEQWMKWRKKQLQYINSNDYATLDRAIEQQVAKHPEQLLSAVLLVAEYSQLDKSAKTRQLMQTIKPEARPERLIATLDYINQHQSRQQSSINNITLYRHNKGIDKLNINKPTMLLLWSRHDADRNTYIDSMRHMAQRYGDKIMLTDILVDTDTTQWSHKLHGDTTSWTHWWAPGGIMDQALTTLNATHTPLLIITDSTGHIIDHLPVK